MQTEPLVFAVLALLLIVGFAFTGNLFHDTRGLRVSLGPPPFALTAKALGSQNIQLSCSGSSVLSNSFDNVTIAVALNQQIACTGTNVSSITWAISPIPTFHEGVKQVKHHAFQVGNQNSPLFNTSAGMNLVNIHLGFESNDNRLGKYEDIFVVSTVFAVGDFPANTVYLVFQPITMWTRTPGVMTQSSEATAGISLTLLILGSLALLCSVVLYLRASRQLSPSYKTLE